MCQHPEISYFHARALHDYGAAIHTHETLITRSAIYELSQDATRYEPVVIGLRVEHHRVTRGEGYKWDDTEARFVPCPCPFCA